MNKSPQVTPARHFYNPLYFIGDAFRSFWRNRVMGIASIFILTSCLILVGAFGLLIYNIDATLDKLGSLNEIVVFLDYEISEDDVHTIAGDIQKLDNVSHVERIDKWQALEEMRELYPEYADILDEMEARGDNPLAESFVVSYISTSTVHDLEYALHQIPGVRSVNNRLDYAVTIDNFKNVVSAVFICFFIMLISISVLVIFNTIKLAVQSRHVEISIMRHIGATKGFIITPFIVEGVIIGLISSVIAFGAVFFVYQLLLSNYSESAQSIIELVSLGWLNVLMFLSFLVIGTVTGALASVISLRKTLKH